MNNSIKNNITSLLKTASFEVFETIVVSLVVIFSIYYFVALPEQVSGESMYPTLHTGQRILVEKLTKYTNGYKRGDIVVLHPPKAESLDYIKRIIAYPGESIKVEDCGVFIYKDGETYKLDESYLSPDTCTSAGPFIKEGRFLKLGVDEFFVMGDNRSNSADSRFFGPVKKDKLIGRAVFRFLPFSKFGFL